MTLSPHLSFNGNCAAAFAFYAKALGGKVTFSMTIGESPMAAQFGPEYASWIMHASVEAGALRFSGADAPPPHFKPAQGITIALEISDPAKAALLFESLSAGGAIQMPLQETFWAQKFAMFTDQFGIPWMINCSKPMN